MDTDLDDRAAYDEDYKSIATTTVKKEPQKPNHAYPYEVDWSDFSKFEPWQYELLAAYHPSESSGDEEIKELIRLSKDSVNLYMKRSRLRKWIPLPKIEHERARHAGKRDHKRLFNAFVNLKLAEVDITPKEKHPKPQRHVGSLMREVHQASQDHLSDDDQELQHETERVISAPEHVGEEDEDDEISSDTDSSKNDAARTDLDLSSFKPGSDSDDPKHERTFNNEKDQAEIDEAFARNHFRLYSTARVKRDCQVSKDFHIPRDVAPIQVCPSLKDLTDNALSKRKRSFYLHRMTYVFGFDEKATDIATIANDFGYIYNAYVNNQNEYYDDGYKLTGILIFYHQGFGIAMIEGSELELMTHFYGLRGNELLKLMDRPKILYIQGHARNRYMKGFSFCMANPPFTLSEKKCKRKGLRVVKSIHRKIKKCCRMVRVKGMTDHNGIYELPFYFTNILPTLNEIEFCLQYRKLRSLEEYVTAVDKIPDISDSSDEGWPPIDEAVPLNIWSGIEKYCNLEREKAKVRALAAKARKLDLLKFAGSRKPLVQIRRGRTTKRSKRGKIKRNRSKRSKKSRKLRSKQRKKTKGTKRPDHKSRSRSNKRKAKKPCRDRSKAKKKPKKVFSGVTKQPRSILKKSTKM